jgi:integrase
MGTPLSLASARRLASMVNRERALGRDFVAARHREMLEREVRAAATFDQAALDFVERHVQRKLRRWHDQARLLGIQLAADGTLELVPKGLADLWRDRSIHDINADDIFSIVDEAREKGVPGRQKRNKDSSEPRARKMHAALSKLYGWLMERRRVKVNPCVGIKTDAPKSRERVLTPDEIVLFWTACARLTRPFGDCIRLLLLTGCRLNEVAGMRRSELSADGKVWTIPGYRTKNHRAHDVPLSTLARDILTGVATTGDFVFTTNGATPISGWSKMKNRLDEAMAEDSDAQSDDNVKSKWRLHDLRRTCATGMAEIGVPPHIVEACLNHISGAKAGVAGIYNRAAYTEEKKVALERWAAHVEAVISERESNVVSIRKARHA